jgi:integrase
MTKWFEAFLSVSEWTSDFVTIQKVLDHYKRKNKSEKTRENTLGVLARFFAWAIESDSPDEYAKLPQKKSQLEKRREAIQQDIQQFLDRMISVDRAKSWVKTSREYLLTHFKVNGWKNGNELEIEAYHVPPRYHKRKEYVPTSQEAWKMVERAGSLKYALIVLLLFTTGLRDSTLCALTYGDIREELEKGLKIIRIPVYVEMKQRVASACKGNIPYYTFTQHAVDLLKTYLKMARELYGQLNDDMPLIIGDKLNDHFAHMDRKTIERAVHKAAKLAGIEHWQDVCPKSLRKAYKNVLKTEYVDGGKMDEKDQIFLTGHMEPGSEDPYYDSSKVEYLRKEYARLDFGKEKPVATLPEAKAKEIELNVARMYADSFSEWTTKFKTAVQNQIESTPGYPDKAREAWKPFFELADRFPQMLKRDREKAAASS